MKIYRNGAGACVNIGEWDYSISEEPQVAVNADGDEEIVMVSVIGNPMPDGLIESDEEVVIGWDGGLYAHDDARQHGAQ